MPTACVNGIDLAYETFGEGEPLVLIMGIGAQMLLWDERFCHALAARGFQVIRFDNRDVGHSTKLDHLPTHHPREVAKRRLLRKPIEAAYTLYDMADDVAGLLDVLALPSAHVVGMSLGGMVAQCMALKHPGRVRSLTLIMTNPGELFSSIPKYAAYRALLSKPGKTRQAAIDMQVEAFRVIGHERHRTPPARVAEIAGMQYDRGLSPRGFARQYAAAMATPSRLPELHKVRAPTVVIHGNDDPLVRPIGGRLLAAVIPGAKLRLIHGMGHDLAPSVWPFVIDAIVDNSKRPPLARPSRLKQLRKLLARAVHVHPAR